MKSRSGEPGYGMKNNVPLCVVLLTPPGRGAVATVRVEGPGACARVDRLFQAVSQRPVAGLAANRFAYGRFRLGDEVYDEVIVRRPGEDMVEIHCHGGPAVVERLIDVLIADGGERIPPERWLEATHPTPIVAAAHRALADAPTLRAAAILLDQYHGTLDRALDEVLADLDQGQIRSAAERIQRLLQVAPCGCHLAKPWRVVLAGRPNVGKSSLTNALVGYRRAIVHELPGTTRDLVTATTALDGWPVELCDTAGLRAAEQRIEQQGIGLAERRLETASLILLLFDAAEPWSQADHELCGRFPDALLVVNKIDLVQPPRELPPGGQPVSALEGRGIDDLIGAISKRLVPNPPSPGEPVPFLKEQVDTLQAAAEAIQEGDADAAAQRVRSMKRAGGL